MGSDRSLAPRRNFTCLPSSALVSSLASNSRRYHRLRTETSDRPTRGGTTGLDPAALAHHSLPPATLLSHHPATSMNHSYHRPTEYGQNPSGPVLQPRAPHKPLNLPSGNPAFLVTSRYVPSPFCSVPTAQILTCFPTRACGLGREEEGI